MTAIDLAQLAGQAQCGMCDWIGQAYETKTIRDFAERLAPGDTVPIGECPECGALAHEIEPPKPDLAAKVRRLRAANAALAEALLALHDACEYEANQQGGDYGPRIGPIIEQAVAALAAHKEG